MKSWSKITKQEAACQLDAFKASSRQLNQFCKHIGTTPSTFRKAVRRYFPLEYEAAVASKKPKSSAYKLGRSFEYRVRDIFKNADYFVVRSAQSKGIADLVALKQGRIVLIQCKRGGDFPGEEWDELFSVAVRAGGIAVFAERPTGRGVKLYELKSKYEDKQSEEFEL